MKLFPLRMIVCVGLLFLGGLLAIIFSAILNTSILLPAMIAVWGLGGLFILCERVITTPSDISFFNTSAYFTRSKQWAAVLSTSFLVYLTFATSEISFHVIMGLVALMFSLNALINNVVRIDIARQPLDNIRDLVDFHPREGWQEAAHQFLENYDSAILLNRLRDRPDLLRFVSNYGNIVNHLSMCDDKKRFVVVLQTQKYVLTEPHKDELAPFVVMMLLMHYLQLSAGAILGRTEGQSCSLQTMNDFQKCQKYYEITGDILLHDNSINILDEVPLFV